MGDDNLYASERTFWSMSCENVVSSKRVRTCVNMGESIMSEVSSRSRLREGEELEVGGGDGGGDGMAVGSCDGGGGGGGGGVETPDSRRT